MILVLNTKNIIIWKSTFLPNQKFSFGSLDREFISLEGMFYIVVICKTRLVKGAFFSTGQPQKDRVLWERNWNCNWTQIALKVGNKTKLELFISLASKTIIP